MKLFGLYQLETIEPVCGFSHYYFFYAWWPVRSLKMNNQYPDNLRLLVEVREERPVCLTVLSPARYFWRKYFKRQGTFGVFGGIRVNWEKEEC